MVAEFVSKNYYQKKKNSDGDAAKQVYDFLMKYMVSGKI